MKLQIKNNGDYIYIYAPYNPKLVEKMKNIGQAKWDTYESVWRLPSDYLEDARHALKSVFGFSDIDPVKMLKVKVTMKVGQCISNKGCITMLGQPIARSDNRVGQDVSFLEGKPKGACGKAMIYGDAVFIIRDVPEPVYKKEKKKWLQQGIELEIIGEEERKPTGPHEFYYKIVLSVTGEDVAGTKAKAAEALSNAMMELNEGAEGYSFGVRK
jgi:hypothetical protein